MSSLAEINQRLIEQNEEQKRTSDAIQGVSNALLTQIKDNRRNKLDDIELRKKATKAKPKGFQEAFKRSAGIEGIGNFGSGILASLFGAGAGLATALGTAAGGLVRLGPAALVLSDFVETAFKNVLDNIDDSVFTGFDLDTQTKDRIAGGAQTAIAARFLGVKSPLGLLSSAIAGAYGDEIIGALQGLFDKDGDGKIEKFGITLDAENKAIQEGIVLTAALIAPAILKLTGKALLFALKKTPSGRVGALLTAGIATLFGLKSDKQPDVSKAPTQPKMPQFEEGSKVSYTKADGTKVDATVVRTLPNQMAQLKFDGGGKIAVDPTRITPIAPEQPKAIPKIAGGVDVGFQKALRGVNALSLEGAVEEASRFGAARTTGATSKVLGTTARVLGSTAGLALSFILAGKPVGDGTISGLIDSQSYALIKAMVDGANDSEILRRQEELKTTLSNLGTELATPTTLVLAEATQNELKNLRSMVYAKATGNIFGAQSNLGAAGAGQLSSSRVGMGRAGYGEELNALDAIAAQNKAMGISPVVIQDNSIKSSGGNTTVTNQIDSPVQSHDASWYQRRSNTGLGF